MSDAKNTFVFFDESSGLSSLLDLIKVDSSFRNTTSIQRSDLLSLLIQSIRYGLSYESGIPIEIRIASDVIDVFAKRLIVKEPYNFDEISEEYSEKMNLEKITENEDVFALEYIKSIQINSLSKFHQTTISVISRHLNKMIRLIEREKEYSLFKDKKGSLIKGTITRFEAGSAVLTISPEGIEGLLPKAETIPGESLHIGDNILVYIRDVRMLTDNLQQYQIILNRSSPEFVMKLIENNIPEVGSGAILIKGCARRPGRLSKVSLHSADGFTNPVWPCIGKGGVRLKHIRSLMANEGLHIIAWNASPAVYVSNALFPLSVSKIILITENEVEAVLTEESFNKALSVDKIQVRLAEFLTKQKIGIISESTEIERTKEEKGANIKLFKSLNLSDSTIEMLLDYGINSVYTLFEYSDEELSSILPSVNIKQLRLDIIALINQKNVDEYKVNNIDIELLKTPSLVFDAAILLEYGIKEKKDFAKLNIDLIINMLRKQLYTSNVSDNDLLLIAEELEEWSKV